MSHRLTCHIQNFTDIMKHDDILQLPPAIDIDQNTKL